MGPSVSDRKIATIEAAGTVLLLIPLLLLPLRTRLWEDLMLQLIGLGSASDCRIGYLLTAILWNISLRLEINTV